MAAARERWVWHISPHFLVLLTQHYQDSGNALTSQEHVTKPTAILSGKKCTVAFVRVRVYVRFVAMGRAVALLGVQTGTRKVRI